ncbi:platelet-activating factor receptor [Chanos chanos]|uniref:Platelet-activating factor receptor n=1 Tax=Chanos chanos TaxID=29144 RepID=A0A6J2WGD4_CHACN|nr:platelet-activating factor receptor [Chanos chanos]
MAQDNVSYHKNTNFLDSEFRYSLFPVFYGLVFVLGLVANLYVLFVLHHMREAKAMNEIRIYMTNLTVADLLFISALPLWIGYYSNHGDWTYSDILCRITGTMFFVNTYCSILFLTVISVNRYWAVTRPLVAASSDCWRRGTVISAVVWVVILSAAANYLREPGVQVDNINGTNISRCFEGFHRDTNETRKEVATYHFVIIGLFFVVFLLVVVCNVLIAKALLAQPMTQARASTSKRPAGTKRRALRMLCAVVSVFVICFLPHHMVQGPWTLAVLELSSWDQNIRQRLNDAHQITLMLMGFNCLLDPVVYCFATRKFRKYIQDHFQKIWRNNGCPNQTTTSNVSMKSRNQSELIHDEEKLEGQIE